MLWAQRYGSGGGPRKLTHSEVGGSEGVRGMPVLADDGGGVALFTAVLALVSTAGHLADAWGEDYPYPTRVVAPCQPAHAGEEEERR